jgi:hypothetical protein
MRSQVYVSDPTSASQVHFTIPEMWRTMVFKNRAHSPDASDILQSAMNFH